MQMELKAEGDSSHQASCDRTCGSRCVSPSRHGFNMTQVMTETSNYPASASRKMPAVTSPRSQNTHNNKGLNGTFPRRSGASPLSVRALNACASPLMSAFTQLSNNNNNDGGGGCKTIRDGQFPAVTRGAAGCNDGRNLTNGSRIPGGVIRGPAGTTYITRMSQHPLYTGDKTKSGPQSKPAKVCWTQLPTQTSQQRRTPLPEGSGIRAAGSLAISLENDTVRGLRGGTGNVSAVTAATALPNAAKRRSVVERVAVAAGVAHTPESSNTAGLLSPKNQGGAATVHFQLPPGDKSSAGRSLSSEAQALKSLPLQDIMKMRLQPPPSNLDGVSSLVQRLPADTLVVRLPEKAQEGSDKTVLAQLSTYKMPQEGDDGNKAADKPTTTTEASSLLPGPGTTTNPPVASTTPSAATQVSPPPPPPMQPSNDASAPTASAPKIDEAVSTACPPLAPLAQPSVATTAITATTGSDEIAAASPSNHSLPVLHASLREPTSEEKAAFEANQLLDDLVNSSMKLKHHPVEQRWNAGHGGLLAETIPDSTTVAGMAALYVQRQQEHNGSLHGWQRPPANVLLPDLWQQDGTWSMLTSAAAQEVQQSFASQAIAQKGANQMDHPQAIPNKDGNTKKMDGRESGHSPAVQCTDYHAPFQQVLHPEVVGAFDSIPDVSGADVDTGVEDDGTGTARTTRTYEDLLASNTACTTLKSFASQAVILRDPLSLLACEHLAEDTVGVVACRRAYLTAMAQLDGALRGATSFAPTAFGAAQNCPSVFESVLQPAVPPGEVFCELSYQAKVLLSTVLYLRALGALPTLLRVGPLTEYSPIVDKKNCIELVFYNPSDKEREQQEAQEAQQERRRRQSIEKRQRLLSVASTAPYGEAPLGRRHSDSISPLSSSQQQQRSRSQQQQQPQRRESSPGSGACSSLRGPPRSLSASASRHNLTLCNGGSTENIDESAHHVPGGVSVYSQRSPLSPAGPHSQSPQQQQQMRRKQGAVEERLMQSLTGVAVRRSNSFSVSGKHGGVRTPPPLPGKAEHTSGVTSKPPLTGAGFTSLASPLLHSAEPSFLVEDAIEGNSPVSGMYRRPNFYNESGGTWLQRSPSQEAASRVRWPSGSTDVFDDNSINDNNRVQNKGVQRQCRGSECCSGTAGSAAIPHVSDQSRFIGIPAALRHAQPSAAPTPVFNAAATKRGAPSSASGVSLRRSSVQLAVEDLKQNAANIGNSAPPTLTSPFQNLNASLLSLTTGQWKSTTNTLASPLQPSVQLESTLAAFAGPPRTTTAAAGAANKKPVSAQGAGKSRFPEGERELCVVLRAVVAQKSLVHAFGKSETVHVLPPLPPRTAEDDVDEEALLRQQVQERKREMHRRATEASNPLMRFLMGTGLRGKMSDSVNPTNETSELIEEKECAAERRKTSLRERARRMAAAARRQGPISVGADGQPTIDDYGDLVVAFVLSKDASELSGSVPDMVELESMRYRIFSLQGYSNSDPSGMHAIPAADAAAVGAAAAASLPASPSVDLRSMTAFGNQSGGSTRTSSPLDKVQKRPRPPLSSYTAFQNSNGNSNTMMSATDLRARSPEASLSVEACVGFSRASLRGLKRRASFFETELRKTDPAYTTMSHTDSNNLNGGEYILDSDFQQLRQRRHQLQRAAMQARYPLYRASSVAESTLQAFVAEAKTAVSTTRHRQRRDTFLSGGGSSSGSDRTQEEQQRRDSEASEGSRDLLAGLGISSFADARVCGSGLNGGSSAVMDTTASAQEAERDLLRFRPMNMNSFHRELVEAVQYAIDLQMWQR